MPFCLAYNSRSRSWNRHGTQDTSQKLHTQVLLVLCSIVSTGFFTLNAGKYHHKCALCFSMQHDWHEPSYECQLYDALRADIYALMSALHVIWCKFNAAVWYIHHDYTLARCVHFMMMMML